jgi:hypothetical protein
MQGDHTRKAGIVASSILGVMTLGVFFGLQNYGPESIVRRFHRAAATGDDQTIAMVTKENLGNRAVQSLMNEIRALANQGYSYEFQRVQNIPEARVTVVYVTYVPSKPGSQLSRPWILSKPEQLWKVEAEATLDPMTFFSRLQRFPTRQ